MELFRKLRALVEGAAFFWPPVRGLTDPILSGDELITQARLPSPATCDTNAQQCGSAFLDEIIIQPA